MRLRSDVGIREGSGVVVPMPLERPPAREARQTTALALGMAVALLAAPAAAIVDPRVFKCEDAAAGAIGKWASQRAACIVQCEVVRTGGDATRVCSDPPGFDPVTLACMGPPDAQYEATVMQVCPPENFPRCAPYEGETPQSFAAAYADPASNPYCADTVRLISIAADGIRGGDGDSAPSGISDDGHVVAFTSAATNLVTDDTNGVVDAFVHDWTTGTTERVSVASDGSEGNRDSFALGLSPDGRFV